MSQLTAIDPHDFMTKPHQLFHRDWLLLTVGDFAKKDFNCMTIGWGSIGTMWNMPYVAVVVRPSRYTWHFMEKYPDFTLTAFSRDYQKDLGYLGSYSGRDGDKLAHTQLTPIAAQKVASPTFAQAELSIECRKIYTSDFAPAQFLKPEIGTYYPEKDYHRVYYGEILSIMKAL